MFQQKDGSGMHWLKVIGNIKVSHRFTEWQKSVNIDSFSLLWKQAYPLKVFRKYDKNNSFILANTCQKIFVRGREELPVFSVWENSYSRNITSNPGQMNLHLMELPIKHLTFVEIDSVLICHWKKTKMKWSSHEKFNFRICFQIALIWPILTNFEFFIKMS